MTAILEHSDRGQSDAGAVQVGERNHVISAKVYQDIYHQLTGRTEQIRKRYSNNLLIEFPELEQLHFKVLQLCDVHNVIAKNETISVFHEKERKEQFTSFERFRFYNSNTASPTVSILLKYNFSILPSGSQRPQEYIVAIRLTSRVALAKQIESDMPPFMRGSIWAYLNENVSEITVDYADYVIARGFIEAFDEWINGCKSVPKKEWLNRLRRKSHLIPETLGLVGIFLIATFALQAIPNLFQKAIDLSVAARFFVIYSAAAFIGYSLLRLAGHQIEYAIDNYPILSYLKLNKGDANLIDQFQEQKRAVAWKFVLGTVFTIILGIISSKLEKMI